MTLDEAMDLLSKTDAEYNTVEEKNYHLVCKMMEILPSISNEQVEQIKDMIAQKYESEQYHSFLEFVCRANNSTTNTFNVNGFLLGKRRYSNILGFYENYDENLIRYIKGHLFIEFAMNTILLKSTHRSVSKYTFSKKIDLLFDGGFIDEAEKRLLKKINHFRNKIAHNLDCELTFDMVFELVELSAKAGVDYSDETIYRDRKLSEEWYGITGVLNELFPNTFCHLLYQNEQYFGKNELLDYMC